MTITLYAGLLGLMFVMLSFYITRVRTRFHVGLGDGGALELSRAIRAQGNFAEYTPLFLVFCMLVEYQGLPAKIIHGFCIAFVLGRIMHAYSLLKAEVYVDGKLTAAPLWRMGGMILTFTCLGLLAALLLLSGIENVFLSK